MNKIYTEFDYFTNLITLDKFFKKTILCAGEKISQQNGAPSTNFAMLNRKYFFKTIRLLNKARRGGE